MKRAIDRIRTDVLEAMQTGRAPWQKPWVPGEGVMTPYNGHTGRRYTGWANVLSLFWASERTGFNSGAWFTFNQVKDMGRSVRKGQKGTHIEFWRTCKKKVKDDQGNETDEERSFPISKIYTVFNEDQLDEPLGEEKASPKIQPRDLQFVLDLADAAGIKLAFGGGDSAYYRPGADLVRSPDLDQYKSETGAIETLVHEFVHWTGHPDRLDRDKSCYATEELVAESGAWLLAMELDLPFSPQNSTSYLAGWASKVDDPEKALDKALANANAAVKYLLDAAEKAGLLESRQTAAKAA